MTEKAVHDLRRLKLTLRQLEVFLATAGAGSTRGAAERISRSQSAASDALGELETGLGVKLFDRLGKRLVLNDSGRLLLPQAAALLDQAADIEDQFQQGTRLPLRIAASLTVGGYLLPQLLAQWKQSHPQSQVQMHIANSTAVMDAVSSLQADVGFIEGPQTHPHLQVVPWLIDEMCIVAAPTHPLVARVATRRQLEQAVWALREPGSGTREAADRWLLDSLDAIDVQYEVGSAEALKYLAAAGVALACLSRRAVQAELAAGTLAEVRSTLPKSRRRLAIVMHRDRRPSRGAQQFVDLCRAQAKAAFAS